MRVRVYWNLTKKMWSVLDKKARKVWIHLPSLVLEDCKFVVRDGGRARVLREKVKNVHAFVDVELMVQGTTPDAVMGLTVNSERVTYNPYKYRTFVKRDGQEAVKTANRVIFTSLETPEGRKPEVLACGLM